MLALAQKLSTEGFTPLNTTYSKPIRTRRVPLIFDHYVDARLRKKWNGRASEQSRWLLRGTIEDLTKEFARPFRIANLQQLPAKKHGQPWQACWAAGVIVYERLRTRYPKRNDSRPIRGALALTGALLGRHVEDSQFRKNRKNILDEAPGLAQWFVDRFSEFKTNRVESLMDLLEDNYPLLDSFSLRAKT
jgi:hypothetical protein